MKETQPFKSDIALRAELLKWVFYAQLALIGLFMSFFLLSYFSETRLGSFEFSFLTGCLGGSLALLKRIRNMANYREIFFWQAILIPILYSGIMAGVAYLLFLSGLLSSDDGDGLIRSNLFPHFIHPDVVGDQALNLKIVLQSRPDGVLNFAKLLIWCFLAGYSEQFVDQILQTLEGGATGSGGNAPKQPENEKLGSGN